jgi:hypothetical protein
MSRSETRLYAITLPTSYSRDTTAIYELKS